MDIIQNNLFTSTDRTLLKVIFRFGENHRQRDYGSTEFAIDLKTASNPPGPTLVANNSIHLTGDQFSDNVGVLVNQIGAGLLSFVEIDNNTIATQGLGIGIKMTMSQDGDFTANAFGNDFHNNKVGVSITGDGTTGIGSQAHIDVGGGNNFRSFKPPASATSAAIVLQNAPTTTVFAERNLFSVTNPSTVVFASSGTIDTSNAIVSNLAFVQTLTRRFWGGRPPARS